MTHLQVCYIYIYILYANNLGIHTLQLLVETGVPLGRTTGGTQDPTHLKLLVCFYCFYNIYYYTNFFIGFTYYL